MTAAPVTHAELVRAGARWLSSKVRCKAVLVECCSWSWPEIPDAIGFRPDGESFLVEAKVSVEDLRAQFRKPSAGKAGMGRHRWFLVPAGLVNADAIAGTIGHWGLLEATRVGSGFRIKETICDSVDEWNAQAEAALLVAELVRFSGGPIPGRRVGLQLRKACEKIGALIAEIDGGRP